MNHKLSNRSISNYLFNHTNIDNGTVDADSIKELAAYAITNNSLGSLDSIVNDYERSLLNKNILIADLISSEQVNDDNKKSLEDKLHNYYNFSKVFFRETIDKNIIGGFKVITPDAEIDGSIENGLTLLRRMKI